MRLSELRMGGGGAFPPVPDWKTYKVGPHTPELENVQRMLSSLGLKVIRTSEEKYKTEQRNSWFGWRARNKTCFQDPWIRNEVWRFDRNQVSMADRPVLIRNLLMRGMKPGFALAVVTAGECYNIGQRAPSLETDVLSHLEDIRYIFSLGIHYYLESKNDHGHHWGN